MGETLTLVLVGAPNSSFSILKRIVMGETRFGAGEPSRLENFQYPQADRDG